MTTTINASTSSGLVQTADTSGVLQLQTANTAAVTIDGSQNTTFAGKITSASALTLASNGTTTAATIDTSQNFLVGATTNYQMGATGTNPKEFIAVNGGAQNNPLSLLRYNGYGSLGAIFNLGASGGASLGTYSAAVSGNGLGTIQFGGDTGASYNGIGAGISSQADGTWTASSNPGILLFGTTASGNTNYTERMRITSAGSLLIGATSSPTASTSLFAVSSGNYTLGLNNGSYTYFFGTASNQFNVYSGEGTLRGYLTVSGTWTNTSDIAFKKDIVDINYSLQDALKLRPVSYVTKDYDIPQIGFIAQEMEQVIPEVVSGEEGSKGISYGSLVALCVKAIQEQQALITTLQTQVAELKQKVGA